MIMEGTKQIDRTRKFRANDDPLGRMLVLFRVVSKMERYRLHFFTSETAIMMSRYFRDASQCLSLLGCIFLYGCKRCVHTADIIRKQVQNFCQCSVILTLNNMIVNPVLFIVFHSTCNYIKSQHFNIVDRNLLEISLRIKVYLKTEFFKLIRLVTFYSNQAFSCLHPLYFAIRVK